MGWYALRMRDRMPAWPWLDVIKRSGAESVISDETEVCGRFASCPLLQNSTP